MGSSPTASTKHKGHIMEERTKAFRRAEEKKAKNKAKRSMLGEGVDSERKLGKLASTHCKPCSCPLCGNPRKYFKARTLEEMRSDLDIED